MFEDGSLRRERARKIVAQHVRAVASRIYTSHVHVGAPPLMTQFILLASASTGSGGRGSLQTTLSQGAGWRGVISRSLHNAAVEGRVQVSLALELCSDVGNLDV